MKDNDSPVKVLLVDDEVNILHALRRLLMQENLEVFTATSADKGIAILMEHEDIGVIISDQKMPGLSGVDFLEKAKKIRSRMTCIILTGNKDISTTISALNRGHILKFIEKPWKDEEILELVREAAHRFRARNS